MLSLFLGVKLALKHGQPTCGYYVRATVQPGSHPNVVLRRPIAFLIYYHASNSHPRPMADLIYFEGVFGHLNFTTTKS